MAAKAIFRIGQLASFNGVDTDGDVFTEVYHYDSVGRMLTMTTGIKGESYSIFNHYDGLGRLSGLSYPGGFTVRHRYNSYGHLQALENAHGSLGNTTVYWQATEDDAFGNITGYTQGNGVLTNKTFNAETGLIASITANSNSNSNSNSIQNHRYIFDTEGNLTSREDVKRTITEHFCYDSLNRLRHSNVGSSCRGGKTISYDYHGNITSRSDVKNGMEYRYGVGAGPHAVTSIGNGNPYRYNAKGEMLSGGGRTGLTYTSYGKPMHMQKGSYYTDVTYGPNQNRIQRIDGGNTFVETTTYIGKLYEKQVSSQQTIERFYIGATAIYTRKQASGSDLINDQTIYLHQDHLGSVVVKTDESGNIIESLANEPWGQQLSDSFNGELKAQDYNPEDTDRGFTGHEHLSGVGLIHMNGRVYDAEIGRFVSPDLLIQDPENSQSFNRYSYVWNNPLRYTDPTGLKTDGGGSSKRSKKRSDRMKDKGNKRSDDQDSGIIFVIVDTDGNREVVDQETARNFVGDQLEQGNDIDLSSKSSDGYIYSGFSIVHNVPNDRDHNNSISAGETTKDTALATQDQGAGSQSNGQAVGAQKGEFSSPVDGDGITITGKFGERGDPYNDNHTAIDIRNAEGGSIYSTEAGVVLSVDSTQNGTNFIRVRGETTGHIQGYYHVNSSEGIVGGISVVAGQLIGVTDLSGRSSGPHLHFTVQSGLSRSTRYNPEKYFRNNLPSLDVRYK